MSKEYCPDCVEELQPHKRKFKDMVNWLKCPKCGFIKRPELFYEQDNDRRDFYTYKERVNSNEGVK